MVVKGAFKIFLFVCLICFLFINCTQYIALNYIEATISVIEPSSEATESVLKVENKDVIFSYYCPCERCCGKNTGITKSGTKAEEGRTIAADKSIPFGSYIYDGINLYIVEDRGLAINGNKFDVFVNSHEKALQNGIQNKNVKIITFENEEEKAKWSKQDILQLLA